MIERGEITKKVGDILKIKDPKTPQIYFLPKIHKNKLPPPGRPIVSANNCLTENISAFVDQFLNPIVPLSDHHVKDTTDFLLRIRDIGKVEKGPTKGSLDVTSLYTNIPNSEGITAIRETLSEHRPNKQDMPSNDSLIQLLKMVLQKNNFQFNDQNYLQIGGIAMGTRVAPSYAYLFMCKLEQRLISNYNKKTKIWLRYIDDIFFVWEHGNTELQNWYEYLNSIKFTMEKSKTNISILDTMVKINMDQTLYRVCGSRNSCQFGRCAMHVKNGNAGPS